MVDETSSESERALLQAIAIMPIERLNYLSVEMRRAMGTKKNCGVALSKWATDKIRTRAKIELARKNVNQITDGECCE